jgi:hypothetical protein
MNDKERLQQIIDSSVISPCEEKVTISKEDFEWLIKLIEDAKFYLAISKGTMDDYSEQIEELEDELARWEQGLNQTKEMYELQRQLRQAQEKIKELTNIKEVEVYDNGYVRIEYQNGETKVISKVVYMDAILTGVTECDDDDTAIDHSKVVLHQKEDGTVQLRDDISFLWCACGSQAVEYVKENESPYQYLCNKCFKGLQEQLEAIDRLRK